MSKPTTTAVTIVCVSLLVGAPLTITIISLSVANASENCLTVPTDQAPQGSHWYYRTDRATQRTCWYLRDSRTQLTQVTPPNNAPLAKLISPQALTTAPGSLVDARAELAAPASTPDPEPNRAEEPPPATVAQTAAVEDNGAIKTTTVETHRSMLMAALALAGVTGSVLFKLGSLRRRPRRTKRRGRRGAIWESVDRARRTTSVHPGLDDFQRSPDFARDLDRARELRTRGREIFSQLSKGS